MPEEAPQPTPAPLPQDIVAPAQRPTLHDVLLIDSKRLFEGATEVQIEHHGVRYRLKQTALGKLILTK